jgi:hypothetical protein
VPERRGRAALVALAAGAAALLAAGGFWTAEIRHSYRAMDLAYSESPQSFRAWLAAPRRAGPDERPPAAAIAGRLVAMPIAARRRLAAALTDEAFWEGIAASETGRRALQESLRQAVLQALEQAPAAGELWTMAAALQTRLDGFDARAARYLAASYRFAPREGQVAYARAGLIVHVLPVLDGALAEAAERDLALIAATYPRLHRAMVPHLQARADGDARR